MTLHKIDIQGFKSFASKTTLLFSSGDGASKGVTAIVGPNGSGKSNIADAVRWVLGEQSMKTLRGKKTEDVIFCGSEKKARTGFCEVSLYFTNDDHAFPLEYPEVVIARRLYRTGESEYLINKSKVRMADIILLLAQAHVGQRSYSVIGQGMIDSLIMMPPAERKEFIDEAAGVKQYQIKKDSASGKLENTREHLERARLMLSELSPRVKFFERQMKRLEQREHLESALREHARQYYNSLWNESISQQGALEDKIKEYEGKSAQALEQFLSLQGQFSSLGASKDTAGGEDFLSLQKKLDHLFNLKKELIERGASPRTSEHEEYLQKRANDIKISKRELAAFAVLPQKQGTREEQTKETLVALDETVAIAQQLFKQPSREKLEHIAKNICERMVNLRIKLHALFTRGEQGAGEKDAIAHAVAKERLARLEEEYHTKKQEFESEKKQYTGKGDGSARLVECEKEIERVRAVLSSLHTREQESSRLLLSLQKELAEKQKELDGWKEKKQGVLLEAARRSAHHEELIMRMIDEFHLSSEERARIMKNTDELVTLLSFSSTCTQEHTENRRAEMERLKRSLEAIGAIDQEALVEYEETKKRYSFLEQQINDLATTLSTLQEAVRDLEKLIEEQFTASFHAINRLFETYFSSLFHGGTAKLILIRQEAQEEGDENGQTEEEAKPRIKKSSFDAIIGVDIAATPPGKRLRHANALSGGEKALTAIALLCAILATNPSPFVLLDEVDAALDESNASRFASILQDLSVKTQFIVITHNRVTIHTANLLYGVTMGDDGISTLLSLDIATHGASIPLT